MKAAPQAADTAPDAQLDKATREAVAWKIEENLTLFFAEYASRLSKTAKTRLYELVNSDETPEYLTSAAARRDPDTAHAALAAKRLHGNFTHKDTVSCREYIMLVKKYVEPDDIA